MIKFTARMKTIVAHPVNKKMSRLKQTYVMAARMHFKNTFQFPAITPLTI